MSQLFTVGKTKSSCRHTTVSHHPRVLSQERTRKPISLKLQLLQAKPTLEPLSEAGPERSPAPKAGRDGVQGILVCALELLSRTQHEPLSYPLPSPTTLPPYQCLVLDWPFSGAPTVASASRQPDLRYSEPGLTQIPAARPLWSGTPPPQVSVFCNRSVIAALPGRVSCKQAGRVNTVKWLAPQKCLKTPSLCKTAMGG